MRQEGLPFFQPLAGVGSAEQTVIQTHFAGQAFYRADPMDYPTHLALVLGIFRVLAQGVRIIGATHFHDLALCIAHHIRGTHHIAVTQPHPITQHQTLELLVGLFPKILTVDIHFPRHRHLTGAHGFILGVHRRNQRLFFTLFPVLDDHFQRIHHAHGPRSILVQVITDRRFQHSHVHHRIRTANPHRLTKGTDRSRGVTAATQPGDGRHARIIPAIHVPFIHQLLELALAGHCVIQVQPGKFILAGTGRHSRILHHPIIKGTMIFEFQRTQAVGNAFNGIRQRVREVIHGVDDPLVTGLVVGLLANPVEDRITQTDIRALHVDFRAQHRLAFVQLVVAHLLEQRQVFIHRPVTVRARLAGRGEITAVFSDFRRAQAVHIGQAFLDQAHRQIIQLVKVVTGKALFTVPLEPQPLHILLDGLDVLVLFLLRIGIVEAQITATAIAFRDTEVEADRFRMADMQVTVGLRRKTGSHLAVIFTFCEVTVDDLSDKIAWRFRFAHCLGQSG